jgi:hypothetical protein
MKKRIVYLSHGKNTRPMSGVYIGSQQLALLHDESCKVVKERASLCREG